MAGALLMFAIAFLFVTVSSGTDVIFTISSPLVTNWGKWGSYQYCPVGKFVKAAQLKIEFGRGTFGDDTALNGIQLFCGDPKDPSTKVITSTVGPWGEWQPVTMVCPYEFSGFELKSESPTPQSGDDHAASNIRFYCHKGRWWSQTYAQKGLENWGWGSWTGWKYCGRYYAICGIQTQVEESQSFLGDDTSLNNVRIACCPKSDDD